MVLLPPPQKWITCTMQKASVAGTSMVQDFKLFDCRITAGSRKCMVSKVEIALGFSLVTLARIYQKIVTMGANKQHMTGITNKWEGW